MLSFFPLENDLLRPEKFIKEKLISDYGIIWDNNHSPYIAGVHDFYQSNEDIVYKIYIRAKRSSEDVKLIKEIANKNNYYEKESVYLGIKLAEIGEINFNNKKMFLEKFKREIECLPKKDNQISKYYRLNLFFKLIKHYGLSTSLINSI